MNTFQHTTARIAAWNLAGYDGIPDERLDSQAEGLAMLDAEIVVFVEINPITALDGLRSRLAAKGIDYDGVVLQQNNKLNIGVMFKNGITATNPFLLDGSDLNKDRLRRALVVDMKVGKFDFKLIAVHLKSSRGAGDQETRDRQAEVIGDFITGLQAQSREDIILCGDFNMIPGQDVSNFHHLGGADLMDFLSSWDLQERFSHILPKGRANLLDGFAINRRFSGEYLRGSLQLFPMHWCMDIGRETFRKTVSDHLPFVASFRIDKQSGG